MKQVVYPMNKVEGRVRVFEVYPDDSRKLIETYKNQITYGAGDILARTLSGDVTYSIDGVFFEFEQLTQPTDSITPTTPTQSDTYANTYVAWNPAVFDAFHAPLLGSPVFSSSDAVKYTGNRVLFYAVASSSTAVGDVNGLTFDPANNSAIRGASLAVVDETTPANSILFSRVSLTKLLAVTDIRVGLEWTLTFT